MVSSAQRRLARWTASPWSRARRGWRALRSVAAVYPSSAAVDAASAPARLLQEPEHVFSREQVFHHHEPHEVQAEVPGDRGWFYRGAEPARVGRPAVLRRLVHASMPGRPASLAGGGLRPDQAL